MELTDAQRTRIRDAILEDLLAGDESYLREVFELGFTGLYNYTDTELVQEYKAAFDEDPLGEEDDE